MDKKTSRLAQVRAWYGKFERPISSISLIWGFVFDAITLTRVDQFWENFWVIVHLLIVAICIVVINLQENEGGSEANPNKLHFWLVNILQFFFGGLLSTYLVFYFRSGNLLASWPFFVILAAAFVANESLKRHYSRLTFQISLLFLSVFLFAIYFVPVLMHSIGTVPFIVSGAASIVTIGIFLFILKKSARERFAKSTWPLFISLIGIFAGINTLYFFNLIPPIPLSLKDVAVYQSFTVNSPGNYSAMHEDQGFLAFVGLPETIHLTASGPLYAYSAIFSPASFNTDIVHVWQYYNTSKKAWITRGRVPLAVVGGSDGGYRTFSMEESLTAGAWRVNVETVSGQILGRLDFNIIIVSSTPSLQNEELN
jgi:hypothetical protein